MNRLRDIERMLVLQCLDIPSYLALAQSQQVWGAAAQQPLAAKHLSVNLFDYELNHRVTFKMFGRLETIEQSRFLQHLSIHIKYCGNECECNAPTCYNCRLKLLVAKKPECITSIRLLSIGGRSIHGMLSVFRPGLDFPNLRILEVLTSLGYWTICTHPEMFRSIPNLDQLLLNIEDTHSDREAIDIDMFLAQIARIPSSLKKLRLILLGKRIESFLSNHPLRVQLPPLPHLNMIHSNIHGITARSPNLESLRWISCHALSEEDDLDVLCRLDRLMLQESFHFGQTATILARILSRPNALKTLFLGINSRPRSNEDTMKKMSQDMIQMLQQCNFDQLTAITMHLPGERELYHRDPFCKVAKEKFKSIFRTALSATNYKKVKWMD